MFDNYCLITLLDADPNRIDAASLNRDMNSLQVFFNASLKAAVEKIQHLAENLCK